MDPPTIETERLTLRGFVPQDTDAFARVMADKEVWRDLWGIPGLPTDLNEHAEWYVSSSIERELRTPELPPTHVPVRSWWQSTRSSLINTRATSCRTLKVSLTLPPDRVCFRASVSLFSVRPEASLG